MTKCPVCGEWHDSMKGVYICPKCGSKELVEAANKPIGSKMERLEYLERAFEEMGDCYDHVSQRCIDAEESVMWLGKLACLIDKQKMEMWRQLVEMAREIKDYPLSDMPICEVMACINKHFPEMKEELEDK